jgi:hypothetical protein
MGWSLLYNDRNFISWFQSRKTTGSHHHVSPFAGRRKATNLMRLIDKLVQIQAKFLEGDRYNYFDIDPVVISGFFFDVCRYCEGSIHILCRDLAKQTPPIRGLLLEFGLWG